MLTVLIVSDNNEQINPLIATLKPQCDGPSSYSNTLSDWYTGR